MWSLSAVGPLKSGFRKPWPLTSFKDRASLLAGHFAASYNRGRESGYCIDNSWALQHPPSRTLAFSTTLRFLTSV